MISEWNKEALHIVKCNMPNCHKTVLFGQSMNGEYQPNRSKGISKDIKIIISYNYLHDIYCAWNGNIQRKLNLSSICVGSRIKRNIQKKEYSADKVYTEYISRNIMDGSFEKIAIIGKNSLYEFITNYEYYLIPNPVDVDIPDKVLYFNSDTDEVELLVKKSMTSKQILNYIRQRDTTTQARRDPEFRSKVLRRYNNTCIVCGCTEKKILQAAHIVDVQYGGNDEETNGVCLCANHHLLYDNALLSIDLETKTFECFSDSEKSMPWYEKAKERNFKLIINTEEESKCQK